MKFQLTLKLAYKILIQREKEKNKTSIILLSWFSNLKIYKQFEEENKVELITKMLNGGLVWNLCS